MSGRYERMGARSRGRSRKHRDSSDAISVALVAQILLCALVLVAAGITRSVNGPAFEGALREYGALVGEDADDMLGDYIEELGGMGQGFFATVEGLIQRAFGGAQPAAPAAELEETLADGDPAVPAPEVQLLGAGGYNPVGALAASSSGAYLPAPAGSTLAPVYLAGDIQPPVTGLVTSMFAYREHPITGEDDFHTGMDIAAEEGRPILAALPGEVIEVGESAIYGNYIILQHATTLQTFYAHCSEIVAEEGMAVQRGQRIAKVGQTGMATGPHLHFSVIVDGLYTDPRHVLGDYLVPVGD